MRSGVLRVGVKKVLLLGLCAIALVAAGMFETAGRHIIFIPCLFSINAGAREMCVTDALTMTADVHGAETAIALFGDAYRHFPAFAGSGCHSNGHLVGDALYRNYLLSGEELDIAPLFTDGTRGCGSGILIGVLEHYFQDHPSAVFVSKTCEAFKNRFNTEQYRIGYFCYHAAGQGFALAQTSAGGYDSLRDFERYAYGPLGLCAALTTATSAERDTCRLGVFHVLLRESAPPPVDSPLNQLYRACDVFTDRIREACYEAESLKLDIPKPFNFSYLASIADGIQDTNLRAIALEVGVQNTMQPLANNERAAEKSADACAKVPDYLYHPCLYGVLDGVFTYGNPEEPYADALPVCELSSVTEKGARGDCYERIGLFLRRTYSHAERIRLCEKFPIDVQKMCLSANDAATLDISFSD